MIDFFNAWKFKHPDANDFIRIMEKVSGLELDWYKEYMVYSTKTIDYAIDTVYAKGNGSIISLTNESNFPMPVDVHVRLKNGNSKYYSIPLDIMRGVKKETVPDGSNYIFLKDWNWVNPGYEIETDFPLQEIELISIDPTRRLADINVKNNTWPESKS